MNWFLVSSIFITYFSGFLYSRSLSIVYFNSVDLGPRWCLSISDNFDLCHVANPEIWETRKNLFSAASYPNITSPRITFKSIDRIGFDVKFKNGKRIHNVIVLLVMAERAEVDIDIMNNTAEFSLICMSRGSIAKFSTTIRISELSLLTSYNTDYPPAVLSSFSEIFGKFVQSGRFTCASDEHWNTTETFNVFLQISTIIDESPFVMYSEKSIQSVEPGNGFIVPCRTNYRMGRSPDLLWKNIEKDKFIMLTAEEMRSFQWDPQVGFQFNTSDRNWEMEILACQFYSFRKTYLPNSNHFSTSVYVTAAGRYIDCELGPRHDSSSVLLASETSIRKKRYYSCEKKYIPCQQVYQSGVTVHEIDFQEYEGNPLLGVNKQSGVVSCFLEHLHKGKLVTETSFKLFFFGLDASVYLLPGSYPNSSVIQISQVPGQFFKSRTKLYHQFTCKTVNFVLFDSVYLILRYNDNTESTNEVRIFGPPEYSSNVAFNVSIETNMTHAICLSLTQDGKVVSAERVLEVFDAFAPLVDNTATNSIHLKAGKLDNDFTLSCPITGGPAPQYGWDFDEKNADLVRGVNTRNLTFQHIHESITGIYTCKASNLYGNNSFQFEVSVKPTATASILSHKTISWISFAALMCLILFFGFMLFALKYLSAKRQMKNLTPEEAVEFRNGVPISEVASHEDGSALALQLPFTKPIQPNSLVLDRSLTLGSGQFGIVYRGFMHGEAVAVKTFKRSVTYDVFMASLVEVKLMNFVDAHPNIVKFIGADVTNIENRDILIVMELSPIGSLDKHLRVLQPLIDNTYCNVTSLYTQTDVMCTYFTLFGFCEQIAFGMEHLENKRVIHGDLAARNVLVFNHGVVKLTDFGYARQLYEKSTYTAKQNRLIPWRWSSIELLQRMEFSTDSDIWAYGVTVWEIFTFGNVPFERVRYSDQFVESLENGLRLEKPAGLSDSQYSFVKECWNVNALARPRFSALKSWFSREKNNLRIKMQIV